MKLYSYFQSSAAYRARIALNLKEIAHDTEYVDLGNLQQQTEAYRSVNPQGLVPVLADGDTVIIQSLPIIEYLEETHPERPLLPSAPANRAWVRGIAQIVACEMHPLNNSGTQRYLGVDMGLDPARIQQWYEHWIARGMRAIEEQLNRHDGLGKFCHGDTPTLADVMLVPQVNNGIRFDCDLTPYPTAMRIFETCNALPAFERAHPLNQPDVATS